MTVEVNLEPVPKRRWEEMDREKLSGVLDGAVSEEDSLDEIEASAEQALEEAGFSDLNVKSVERNDEE